MSNTAGSISAKDHALVPFKQKQSPLSQLPIETLVQVLKHLRLRDIVAFGITCKHFREISKADSLWSILFAKHFPSCKISVWTSAMTLTKDIPGCANLTAYKKRAMYSDPLGDPYGQDWSRYSLFYKKHIGDQIIRK